MGYLFLSLALAAGITKGYCGKKTSYAIVSNSDSMIMNLLRMLICVLVGLILTVAEDGFFALKPDTFMIFAAALSGIASAAFVVSWLLSIRTGAYMMVEVFLLLGVIVTVVLCRIFFGEAIGAWQIVGMVILVAAVYIMTAYNSSVKGRMSISALVLLMICGLSYGISDFSQKLFTNNRPNGSVAAFNLYTYVFAALALVAAYFIFRKVDKRSGTQVRSPLAVIKPIWYFVLIMAVCLFANSFFKTRAALHLDAVMLYPLNQGCAVVLSLLMSSILFKEKINAKCIIGICLSFVALLMINLLK